jgi:hypothetical protein
VRAFGEKLRQARRRLRNGIGARDADDIEAEVARRVGELGLERVAQKSRLA